MRPIRIFRSILRPHIYATDSGLRTVALVTAPVLGDVYGMNFGPLTDHSPPGEYVS